MAHTLCEVESNSESNSEINSEKIKFYNTQCYQASAPGSLMLFGEHAVLTGKRAIVVAVNQRIKVTLLPRKDTMIRIKSALGEYEGTVEEIKTMSSWLEKAPFHFVLTAIAVYREKLSSGFDLTIDSDFSSTLGLGSSAAVVVATLRVVSRYVVDNENDNDNDNDNENEKKGNGFDGEVRDEISNVLRNEVRNDKCHSLFKQARSVIEAVQGQASGADVAASVFGGVVLYRKDPLLINLFPILPPLVATYVGYKTPTPEVIQKVKTRFEDSQYLLECLFDAMEVCTETALLALQQQQWCNFGHCMNVAHGLLNALGVSDSAIEQAVKCLRDQQDILGAKISGAGLGDCVIGVRKMQKNSHPNPHQHEDMIASHHFLEIEPCLQGVSDA